MKRKACIGAVLLASALAACARKARIPDVPVVEVKRTHFARTVDADGYLKAEKATSIAPEEADGPLRIAWLAEDGINVKAGDVVARFSDTELRSRLSGAEDDRTSALTKKKKEVLLVAQAGSDRERARQSADRELEMARKFQRKDPDVYSRDDIIEGEIDEKLQNATAGHARDAQVVDRQVSQRKLKMQEVDIKRVDEQIKRAQKGLKTLELRAPHDGVLVFSRNYFGEPLRIGDTIWQGQKVGEVPLVDKLEAEVFVLEVEAAGLAKGKKAEIVLESQPGRTWKASVKQVASVAKRRLARSPTQYFVATLTLDATDRQLMKPGQRVRARLFIDEQETLVVPRPAIFDKDGKWVAYRRDPKGFTVVPVKLGPSTAGLVVIDSGLKPGDVIALRDPGQTLEDILAAPLPGAKAR